MPRRVGTPAVVVERDGKRTSAVSHPVHQGNDATVRPEGKPTPGLDAAPATDYEREDALANSRRAQAQAAKDEAAMRPTKRTAQGGAPSGSDTSGNSASSTSGPSTETSASGDEGNDQSSSGSTSPPEASAKASSDPSLSRPSPAAREESSTGPLSNRRAPIPGKPASRPGGIPKK